MLALWLAGGIFGLDSATWRAVDVFGLALSRVDSVSGLALSGVVELALAFWWAGGAFGFARSRVGDVSAPALWLPTDGVDELALTFWWACGAFVLALFGLTLFGRALWRLDGVSGPALGGGAVLTLAAWRVGGSFGLAMGRADGVSGSALATTGSLDAAAAGVGRDGGELGGVLLMATCVLGCGLARAAVLGGALPEGFRGGTFDSPTRL